MSIRFSTLLSLVWVIGCSGEFSHADQGVGENGEPPKALVQVYKEQFLADERNYVLALGQIHSFLVENQFSTKYTDCFDDVLDIRKRKKGFSCMALRGDQGPPTKVYFRVVVDEVHFNQLDGHNRLLYSAEMYALDRYVRDGIAEQLIQNFESGTGPKLAGLYSGELGEHGSNHP
ncbi:hypothetical protein [Microbulbifer halophilus]|uniref:Uncharacterized protein n=1 Tax=Microbulbifer halophilus TaxID=453963 RepID=A0ABW5EF07_9GAMM|nr:hypothetical protein [Microbulbifer halophilus]MCW8128386.1 hypothetical protein [Microbulbifer halophilus]